MAFAFRSPLLIHVDVILQSSFCFFVCCFFQLAQDERLLAISDRLVDVGFQTFANRPRRSGKAGWCTRVKEFAQSKTILIKYIDKIQLRRLRETHPAISEP